VKEVWLRQYVRVAVRASPWIADRLEQVRVPKIGLDLRIASALFRNRGEIFESRGRGGKFEKIQVGNIFPPGLRRE